jgi:hypothetical protein
MIFKIGTFPFMMMGANCLFLLDACAHATDVTATSIEHRALGWRKRRCGLGPGGLCVAVIFACLQLLLPLRHLLYPGPVMWYRPTFLFGFAMVVTEWRRFMSTGQDWGITAHG